MLFNVQHSGVQDHRPEFGSLFGLARLPIGYFALQPVGTVTDVDWRLGLYDAELTGTITTDAGTLRLRALVHNSRSVLAVEVVPSAGESGFRWTFQPAVAVSPRIATKTPAAPDTNYDLMLLRWGCATLPDSARVLGIDDELAPRWGEVLARLTPYPFDENGFMIGAGVPFAKSHRHYSHMLAG